VIAAGGIADGVSMAAAFALGAEGVQMGTRMVASAESGVHVNMKNAVVDAAETDTMLINQHNGKPVRVLRTAGTAPFEYANEGNPMALLGSILDLYERGDMDASLPQLGQVAGRIVEILPAAEIIRRTIAEFAGVLGSLSSRYLVTG
jgi:enoyl-[acyl-carrier protein] reductase II